MCLLTVFLLTALIKRLHSVWVHLHVHSHFSTAVLLVWTRSCVAELIVADIQLSCYWSSCAQPAAVTDRIISSTCSAGHWYSYFSPHVIQSTLCVLFEWKPGICFMNYLCSSNITGIFSVNSLQTPHRKLLSPELELCSKRHLITSHHKPISTP